ncbi:MAG: ankyrin repeat domain-containing protein [Verrucomicrobia bacterium]|nr:ankyrin repeat domain-containing protein [Verrucomicrobiota bacterium]
MKRLFRRIQRSPLKAFAVSALLLVVLTAAAWKFLIPLGVIALVGIGEGYPPIAMKILGCTVLAMTALGWLASASIAGIALVYVEIDRTRPLASRLGILAVTVLIAGGLSFAVWLHGRDDAAVDAIIRGNIQEYEAAVRWRQAGNLDDDLWLAARWGRLDIVKLLVAMGANPAGSKYGSALAAARENLGQRSDGNRQVIDFLLTNRPPPRSEPKQR